MDETILDKQDGFTEPVAETVPAPAQVIAVRCDCNEWRAPELSDEEKAAKAEKEAARVAVRDMNRANAKRVLDAAEDIATMERNASDLIRIAEVWLNIEYGF